MLVRLMDGWNWGLVSNMQARLVLSRPSQHPHFPHMFGIDEVCRRSLGLREEGEQNAPY